MEQMQTVRDPEPENYVEPLSEEVKAEQAFESDPVIESDFPISKQDTISELSEEAKLYPEEPSLLSPPSLQ